MSKIENAPTTSRKLKVAAVATVSLAGSMAGVGSQAQAETFSQRSTTAVTDKAGKTALIGYDVSYPQGGEALPKNAAFAIVGINYPNAATQNTYFQEEYKWALTTKGDGDIPAASAYVISGNPVDYLNNPKYPDVKKHWPKGGESQFGSCNDTDNVACSGLYGIQRASQDIKWALPDKPDTVWIDYEPDLYTQSTSPAKNAAELEGMISEFEKHDIKVGLYFQDSELTQSIGVISKGSNLDGLPEWLLGATSKNGRFSAEANCKLPSLTGGPVEIAQIAGSNLDEDIAC